MMARLRGVQGVTRVSLSQSQKDDVQKGASSSAVSEGGDKPLCGPGSHPTFDMVIFFERDAALSSEPNVQATPATGGATPPAGGATPAAGGSSSSVLVRLDGLGRRAPGRGHPVTRSLKIVLPVALLAAMAAAAWFLVIAPKREEAARLSAEVATADAELADLQAKVADYTKARERYPSDYATVTRLGKAVPADDDTGSLMVQLDSASPPQRRRLQLDPAHGRRSRRRSRRGHGQPDGHARRHDPRCGGRARQRRLHDALHLRLRGRLLRPLELLRPPASAS